MDEPAGAKVSLYAFFIDEATLFHLGAPCGRTVRVQIEVFETIWLQWACPCNMLYLDPAGECENLHGMYFSSGKGFVCL